MPELTMFPRSVRDIPVSWELKQGWMLLLPSRLPEKTEGGIILPETVTVKQNSGICIKLSDDPRDEILEGLLKKELFFPAADAYRIVDSDLDQDFYLISYDNVIMWRTPPKKTVVPSKDRPVSKEKGKDV